jgi:hypothetical protein
MKWPTWIDCNDVVFILSAAAIGYGVWQLYQYAAFIVVGTLFLALSLFGRFK